MNNPAVTLVTQTQRVWTDNGNFTPDCNLQSGAEQDNRATGGDLCGPWQTPNFGSAVPGTRYDPAIMNGWGERPWNWEFSTSVQHEIIPRLSVTFGYFRRILGNFYVMDNEALSASDFTQFSVTRVSDARLEGAGEAIGGFYDPNFIVAPQNVVKAASEFGKQKGHWNGFDINANTRLHGLYIQGGTGIGKMMSDVCEIVDDVPETLFTPVPPAGQAIQPGIQQTVKSSAFGIDGAPGTWTSAEHCHQETPWQAQYKALASYTLPWWGIRASGTWQSIIGPQLAALTTYSETANGVSTFARTSLTSLARPLTNTATTVNVMEPGTEWGDRLNQFDLRFTKVVDVGKGRLDLNFDLYNAFNSDAITLQLNSIGPVWQLPLTVIPPRFIKLSARWDF